MSYKNKNNLNLVTNNFFLELVFSSLVLAESFPLQLYEMYSNRGSWLKTLFYRLEVMKEALVPWSVGDHFGIIEILVKREKCRPSCACLYFLRVSVCTNVFTDISHGLFYLFFPHITFLMIRPLSWMTTAICFQFQTWIESILHKKWPSKFLFKCSKLRDAVVIFSAGCALVSLAGSHTPPQFNKWRGH